MLARTMGRGATERPCHCRLMVYLSGILDDEPMAVQLHCTIKKRASVSEKKEFPLAYLIKCSTRYLSLGTEVTLVTEYVYFFSNNPVFSYKFI